MDILINAFKHTGEINKILNKMPQNIPEKGTS
jgi:hypothetical protein